MIDFIRNWANQIIVAIIIATIFEMILPNGKNKKYIKMIIGIYVLFTLIQPIVNKITGDEFEISSFKYEKYFNNGSLEISSNDFENNNSNLIKQAYIDNIKNDIKTKISKKGYELISCNIDIETDESKDDYGAIKNIILRVEKISKEIKQNNNIEVQKIEINPEDNKNDITQSNLTKEEKAKLIEYLNEEYSIDKKNIVID